MYTYKIGISREEHDNFIKNSNQTNLLQSSAWAKVKNEWGNERIGFYHNDKLVASASILIRPLPLGMTMFYIPRGPVMDYQNKDLVNFVLSSLKRFAKRKRALFIKFDPFILLNHHQIDEEDIANPQAQDIIANLKNSGCEWLGQTADMGETIQPRFQANIYAKDFSEANLSKKIRQSIRTAKNKGLTLRFGSYELLEDFANLMKKTEDRKSIHLRGIDYYRKLLDNYPKQSFITLASLNLKERLADLENQREKAQDNLAKFGDKVKASKIDNTKKEIERLNDEITFLQEHLSQGKDTVPLSGTLSLEFGGTSENVYAGMDEEFRRYQAAIYTWFATANHAFERGSKWQNMGGIENDLSGGLYSFKSKFKPEIEEFIGEFNLPVSPLYKLANIAYTLRKKQRSKH
ncbi:aminoacyltransferase [Streptococcus ratti]|uniref:Peptidoglycan branched peptide synthesis protein MurM n=1 Tax=Streptococcus ratti FA-1 = DSM 20564 TaxID=699248 RepID=A0ABN0GSU3_STRRT|nr:aminoacyltransferase [Streptococcus ratti]EJN93507.1 putative peptidoglycan branched peptide synthesis protein MurM [Streptococcus ratti FA-1 = DSM 20564]EMP71746.1 putative peptidoglycan branched peptide synthesis protein [Streptococcus ratti FA-1 = DSM 20564]QEY07384.1 aminoacyltransferase [Streptococcus ratti]VEI59829.1 peptidoglycan branched peptide synthesis protein MurM [Streptococcus mutans]